MVMPKNIPSDSSQRKILKAFKKVGWQVLDGRWGKGSHRIVKDPKSGFEQTVQYKIYKEVINTFCKRLEDCNYDASEFIRYI